MVDDDPAIVELMLSALRTAAVSAEGFTDPVRFLERDPTGWDLIFCDLEMPGTNGLELLQEVRDRASRSKFVIITGHGTVPTAVRAMKEGAADFLVKPFKMGELLDVVKRAWQPAAVGGGTEPERDFAVGSSAAWRDLLAKARRVAELPSTVLIRGETGTGKDVLARYIGSFGPRAGKPFVVMNCAAVPENLIESELFGHVRGAFTGATAPRRGLFEEASGGTLFLDEVGTMPPQAQAKLLRVLEDRAVRRVGDNRSVPVDVRILAATNLDLEAAVARHSFRDDLYYRLSVVSLVIPPLRERREDIPLLAEHFLKTLPGGAGKRISRAAQELLTRYSFPGNVRELKHALEQAAVFSNLPELHPEDFPLLVGRADTLSEQISPDGGPQNLTAEKLREALEKTAGNRVEAAKLLGISRSTLYRFLRQSGLPEEGA